MTPFDESTLPAVAPASVDESTSEGLMLAEYASRMRLKNAIIVGVLTRRESYSPDDYVEAAAGALEHLASEFVGAAERMSKELSAIANLRGSAVHAHDYRSGDAANLRHREAVLDSLVIALRTRRDDEAYVLDLVESARRDAWTDIARAMGDSLDRSTIVVDENYLRERSRRMRQVSRDLARLASNSPDS